MRSLQVFNRTHITFMGTPSRSLLRTLGRSLCTTAGPSHRSNNHKFLDPTSFIGSWESPRTPKEAEKRLTQLRRDYAKQVKETRKGYIHEMELLRLDKLRKDQAKQEALRVANEERKRLKAEAAKVRAQERKLAEEEFRQTLEDFFLVYTIRFPGGADPPYGAISPIHTPTNPDSHRVGPLRGKVLPICAAPFTRGVEPTTLLKG